MKVAKSKLWIVLLILVIAGLLYWYSAFQPNRNTDLNEKISPPNESTSDGSSIPLEKPPFLKN